MVSLKEVRASNNTLKTNPTTSSLTAVFVGATSGIGYGTLRELASHSSTPKVYIVGRSLAKFTPQLEELKSLNPNATFIFLEAQASLLKDVEKACEEIKSKENKLDLLFVSTGYLSLAGREVTSEGLPAHLTVAYYSRMLFVSLLLPLLKQSTSPRVISVLAGGQEAAIATDDLTLSNPSNYSFPASAVHSATMTSLAFDALSAANPSVSFIHIFPGFVNTTLLDGLSQSGKGLLGTLVWLAGSVLLPVLKLFATSLKEAGERELYVSTSERYAVGQSKGGFWRLKPDGDEAGDVAIFETYREEGMAQKIWDHTLEIFQKGLSAAN